MPKKLIGTLLLLAAILIIAFAIHKQRFVTAPLPSTPLATEAPNSVPSPSLGNEETAHEHLCASVNAQEFWQRHGDHYKTTLIKRSQIFEIDAHKLLVLRQEKRDSVVNLSASWIDRGTLGESVPSDLNNFENFVDKEHALQTAGTPWTDGVNLEKTPLLEEEIFQLDDSNGNTVNFHNKTAIAVRADFNDPITGKPTRIDCQEKAECQCGTISP